MKNIFSLLSLLLSLQNFSFAQDQHLLDSLETQLKNHNAKKTELQIKSPTLVDTTAAIILYELSRAYWGNNPDTGIYYANQCLALSEQIGFKKGIGRAYSSMGVNEGRKGNYLYALEFHKKATKIFEEIGYKKGLSASYSNIGLIFEEQGNHPEALKSYFSALKIAEEQRDKIGIANCYGNTGVVYKKEGNYTEAMKNYLAALKIYKELGDKLGIASSYNNIGVIYKNQGNYAEALKNYLASLKIKEEVGNKKGIGGGYSNIGDIYAIQGNYREAMKNYLASLKIRLEIGDKNGIAISYNSIGDVYLKEKKYKQAKEFLYKELALSKEIGSLELIKSGYGYLAELDSAQGNYNKALEHYKLYITFRDSISNKENTMKIVALQMNYDFSKKQDSLNVVQAKKDLVAQKELNKQKLIRNGFIGGTAIFLLLAGIAILFFINRIKRKRKKQMEAVRARISRDLHDDMGSTLQSISVMSEIVRMKSTSDNRQEAMPFIEKIGSASREMIDKMTDIVWAVSPQNDNFENIILHMRAFGGELLAGKDIALHFKADSGLNNIMLSMERRKSFFLVYKEALNNAYKYSGAKNVKVEISKTNHALKLVVEDDGVGFNMKEDRLKTGGNGLKNMNTRAGELNGSISITSEPGHGTTVSLIVNLK